MSRVILHPKAGRSSNASGFVSIGASMIASIEEHNHACEEGAKIDDLGYSKNVFSRLVGKSVKQHMSGSALFSNHMGNKTLKEIKAEAKSDAHFENGLQKIMEKVAHDYPILKRTQGQWGPYEAVKNKLVNLKKEKSVLLKSKGTSSASRSGVRSSTDIAQPRDNRQRFAKGAGINAGSRRVEHVAVENNETQENESDSEDESSSDSSVDGIEPERTDPSTAIDTELLGADQTKDIIATSLGDPATAGRRKRSLGAVNSLADLRRRKRRKGSGGAKPAKKTRRENKILHYECIFTPSVAVFRTQQHMGLP